MAVILAMTAIGAWAVSTHQISYEITHGVSMEPTYHQSDLVFTMKADSYHSGDIAAYHGSSPGLVVLHRIIGGDATGFVFKGDNNQSTDPLEPSAEDLIGRAVLHVPKGGLWLGPLLSPTGLGMIGFMIVSGGAAATRTRRDIPRGRRKKKVNAMSRQGTLGTTVSTVKAVAALPPLLRTVAVTLAVAGASGVALAVLGWMGPVIESGRPAADAGHSMAFSYAAQVAKTPAYDSTTVTAPDPIFRKLAHFVDVTFDYRGRPGTVEVLARLSTASGWHTTMQLAPPASFAGHKYRGTVRLDLDAFDSRAQAAAHVIGVDAGQVAVAVVPNVTSEDAAPFAPALPLSLTPLQLSLVGGVSSLAVDNADPGAQGALAPRIVSVLGVSLMNAAAARAWSICLLLGALFGAIGIALIMRRATPVHDSLEIHHRFPQLLVPVEPMASPPGKPVVNVDDFQALVRLAERYGQLILHWSRNQVETFVVRDEGITYRYRTADEPPEVEETLVNVDRIATASATQDAPATTTAKAATASKATTAAKAARPAKATKAAKAPAAKSTAATKTVAQHRRPQDEQAAHDEAAAHDTDTPPVL